MNVSSDTEVTFKHIISAFTDFLTVAIHTILYERNIYPQTSFLSVRKYNFPVRQNRHPKVCEWINDAVDAVEAELLKNAVARVAVVIFTERNKPVERFVFDVSRFPEVPAAEADLPLESPSVDGSKLAVLPIVDLQEQLRATMSRLSNCSSSLAVLPKGCTFTVVMELKPKGEAPLNHPQRWIPAENSQQSEDDSLSHLRSRPPDKTTTPIRTVRAGELLFETWIEHIDNETESSSVTTSSFG